MYSSFRNISLWRFLRTRISYGLAVSALFLFVASGARAEEVSAEDKAAARNLAVEGIQLAEAGNCEKAIEKLSRAEKLFHAPTILTWIGQCQIELGRLVEGTETLNQVVREKTASDAPEAYLQAQEKAARLIGIARPQIAKLTIVVEPEDAPGLVISVDGRSISSALIGAARPSDPGIHTIIVKAPGYLDAIQEVNLKAGAEEHISFTLEAKDVAAVVATEKENKDDLTDDEPMAASKSSKAWIGWTSVGVGGAFLAAGSVTGILAITKKNSLDCDPPSACDSAEQDTLDAANLNATLSTIFFGVGSAAVITGVIILILDRPSPKTKVGGATIHPTLGIGSLGLAGTF